MYFASLTTFTICVLLFLQTISASDVASTTRQGQLRTFGWSLTSGVDVDNNQYLGECVVTV